MPRSVDGQDEFRDDDVLREMLPRIDAERGLYPHLDAYEYALLRTRAELREIGKRVSLDELTLSEAFALLGVLSPIAGRLVEPQPRPRFTIVR